MGACNDHFLIAKLSYHSTGVAQLQACTSPFPAGSELSGLAGLQLQTQPSSAKSVININSAVYFLLCTGLGLAAGRTAINQVVTVQLLGHSPLYSHSSVTTVTS